MRRCPTSSISTGYVFPCALAEAGDDVLVHGLARKNSQGLLGRFRQVGVGLDGNFQQRGQARRVSHASECADGREANRRRGRARRLSERRPDRRSPCGRPSPTMTSAARSGKRSSSSAARAWSTSRPGNSRAVLSAIWKSPLSLERSCSTRSGIPSLPAGENRAARRLEHSLPGNIGLADFVVDLRRLGRVAFGQETLGAQDAAFGDRRADADRARRPALAAAAWRRGIADAPQGHGSGRGDFGIFVLQAAGQEIDGARVAADADRIDHADEQSALAATRSLCAALRRPPRRESLPARSVPTRRAVHWRAAWPARQRPRWSRRRTGACRRGPSPPPACRSGEWRSARAPFRRCAFGLQRSAEASDHRQQGCKKNDMRFVIEES